jgi:predicted Rossmann fold nucleotide-binding protein DprA/Smf involved in DNA uptake
MKVYQQRQLSSASSYKTDWVAQQLTFDSGDSQPPVQKKPTTASANSLEKPSISGPLDNEVSNSAIDIPALGPSAQQVLDAVGFEATHTDHIVERTGLKVSEVQAQLMQLELAGLVRSESGGFLKFLETCQ